MKRFTWNALVSAAVLVCAASTATATSRLQKGTAKLYPVAESPFPSASGTVTWYRTVYVYPPGVSIIVSVSKLAPNASYYMPVLVYDPSRGWWPDEVWIQTDSHGNGGSEASGWELSTASEVYDSSGTLVLSPSR